MNPIRSFEASDSDGSVPCGILYHVVYEDENLMVHVDDEGHVWVEKKNDKNLPHKTSVRIGGAREWGMHLEIHGGKEVVVEREHEHFMRINAVHG